MRFLSTIIIYLLISTSSFALDKAVLNNQYPDHQYVLSNIFVDLKSYFRTFFQNGTRYYFGNNIQEIVFENSTIRLQVERIITTNTISEKVIYALPNGRRFEYIFSRVGTNLLPTQDTSLLEFNFPLTGNENSVVIEIPQFDFKFELTSTNNKDRAHFLFGLFQVNFAIETYYLENSIKRDYIWFSSWQNNPQSHMSVLATNTNSNFDMIQFIHFTPLMGGEITPQKFFMALNDSASMMKSFSEVMRGEILDLGFVNSN